MRRLAPALAVLAGILASACTGPGGKSVPHFARDWAAHPAIVDVPSAPVLFAISDVHGGCDRAVELLTSAGVIDAGRHWAAGAAVLVVVGDSIDKGDQSMETLALWQALEPEAAAAGGRIIALLGNHEAEVLADPSGAQAAALADELAAHGLTTEEFVAPTSASGQYLRSMPFAARVAGWFFVHAGTSDGMDLTALGQAFQAAVDRDRWDDDILGGVDSPLEAREWWSKDSVASDLAALGANHLVMGHDPHAFGEDGLIGAHYKGRLVRIDTGMSPAVDLSRGHLLRVDAPGTAAETATSISHKGATEALDMTTKD